VPTYEQPESSHSTERAAGAVITGSDIATMIGRPEAVERTIREKILLRANEVTRLKYPGTGRSSEPHLQRSGG
jgi:hypothetical protein